MWNPFIIATKKREAKQGSSDHHASTGGGRSLNANPSQNLYKQVQGSSHSDLLISPVISCSPARGIHQMSYATVRIGAYVAEGQSGSVPVSVVDS